MIRQFRLTPDKTVFEYEDEIGTDNLIVYHPGFIRINEIEYYQQFLYETIDADFNDINNTMFNLFNTIHDINFRWVRGDLELHHHSIIMFKIISRLKCIADEYNGYYYFANLNLRGGWDGEEYQTNLAHYIINTFIDAIGLNQTIILFAKHFGNIIENLYHELY